MSKVKIKNLDINTANRSFNLPEIGEVTLNKKCEVKVPEEIADLMVNQGKGWEYAKSVKEVEEVEEEDEELDNEDEEEEDELSDEERATVIDTANTKVELMEILEDEPLFDSEDEDVKSLKNKGQLIEWINANWEELSVDTQESLITD